MHPSTHRLSVDGRSATGTFAAGGWEVEVIHAVALARDYRHLTMVGHGVGLRKPMGLAQWLKVPVAFMVRWLWISMMRILASFPSVRLAG